ncbi:MAG: aspartate kinase [Acidobacteriia bacterium]|nr:aspartate kinase [Terriglobia bacterium]
MIVMKFGGTSVADAGRILGVVEIVRRHLDRRPVVVVSALAGVTDLLVRAVDAARRGDREALEPVLADVERRHRWALAGSIEDPTRRHDLSLEVDALFEDLRQLLRSVRILGEGTPRSSDTLLSFGEILSSRLVASVLQDRGLPARWVDPREVLITDATHGAAEPDLEEVARRAEARLAPILESAEVPVTGGFVGATRDGRTTTVGRGGSDTSAAVIGSAMGAAEIQIWTDVDGLMTADPKLVPAARTIPRVSFAEAAELAYYGAKVLHPSSIAPAVRRAIPVRVLNSLAPDGDGTLILAEGDPLALPIVSVASRGGVRSVRIASKRMRLDTGFLPAVLAEFDRAGLVPDLLVSSEVAVSVAVRSESPLDGPRRALSGIAEVDDAPGRALLSVVGSGLAREGRIRGRVLSALAETEPEIVALGGSGSSVTAVIREDRLAEAVRGLHRRFFEDGGEEERS